MDLPKRPDSRESLIDYLLQPSLDGPPIPVLSIASLPNASAFAEPTLNEALAVARSACEVMSDSQIGDLVAKKRQQEDDAKKVRLAEQARLLLRECLSRRVAQRVLVLPKLLDF